MHVDLQSIKALQQLRIDLQESAGLEFPHAYLKELLILYDVCKYLELNIFQVKDVLGIPGYTLVTNYINQPLAVDYTAINEVLASLQPG